MDLFALATLPAAADETGGPPSIKFYELRDNLLSAGLVTAAGIAAAAIPDGNGVIHGCYVPKIGVVRVIDTAKGQTCTSVETALNWNREGRKGDTGATGPSGPAGATGPKGDPKGAGSARFRARIPVQGRGGCVPEPGRAVNCGRC